MKNLHQFGVLKGTFNEGVLDVVAHAAQAGGKGKAELEGGGLPSLAEPAAPERRGAVAPLP
ncbi:hypothetical protein, partial [Falsigemmobacter intermedius]